MGASLRLSTGSAPIKKLRYRDASGVHDVKHGYVRTTAGIQSFYGSFSVSLSTPAVHGAINSGGPQRCQTTSVTAQQSGAIGNPTYSWARTDGGTDDWTIGSPSSATTTFNTLLDATDTVSATFACTVVDGSGQSLTTGNVSAVCVNRYSFTGTL